MFEPPRLFSDYQVHSRESHFAQQTANLLESVRALIPEMQARGEILDRESAFPQLEFKQLRNVGALSAIIPCCCGGLGLGIDSSSSMALFKLLRLLGRGNLAVGRIFEGHVNALKLIAVFGSEEQLCHAAEDVRAGHLFAIWNTEQGDGVQLSSDSHATLAGAKMFCSGAGFVTRALITARAADGMRMLLIPLECKERVDSRSFRLHGMRATQTGTMIFDGIRVSSASFIGEPGDYTREPTFSAGAWRTSAVVLGGLDFLVEETQQQLISRKRHTNPHQLSRIGEVLIARESARLWVQRAARLAEDNQHSTAAITGYVNLARLASESATLKIISLIQRTIGLSAFLQTNPIERLMRDLATYSRQPAPDEALTEAAAWFMENGFPEDGQ